MKAIVSYIRTSFFFIWMCILIGFSASAWPQIKSESVVEEHRLTSLESSVDDLKMQIIGMQQDIKELRASVVAILIGVAGLLGEKFLARITKLN